MKEIWTKFMPLPNNPQGGDQYNTQGYLTAVRIPQRSNFAVARVDHDFGAKWRFMASYRYYHFSRLTTDQVDIGGALPGDTFGQAAAKGVRPQVPSYYVAGLTTNITSTLTNDFHVNYLRNWWQWSTSAAPPQLPGLGGAVEIGGESANALIPYNVNTQSARQRFWDGQDWVLRDDLTKIRGNHLFQFGGMYQRNYDYHDRNDNGQGIMNSIVYQIHSGSGIQMSANYRPAGLPANQNSAWDQRYAHVLGLVSQPQVLYTRSGSNLDLQPLGTSMFDQSIIGYYNVYFSDTWRMRPSLTLTYGMGYTIETPPYEINGKQVGLVDAAGRLVDTQEYLAQRQKAALAGQVYNPTIGFAIVPNITGSDGKKGVKYPYDSFYGGLSPRVALAWNPSFSDGILGKMFGQGKTVLRGGYSRLFGRLNGVNQVLVPLLGTGLGQAVSCIGASRTGGCNVATDPTNVFRIGTDGMTAPLPTVSKTLPQPYYPGVGGNPSAADGSVIDPSFKPNRSDQFTFSIQRELSPQLMIEVGYIGRIIKNEYQQINLDAVPHMTTLGGQTFSAAFANLYDAVSSGKGVTPQPFFEAALGGPASGYCTGFVNCTAAVASKQASNITTTRVYDLWGALNSAAGWTLGRTMPSTQPGRQVSAVFENLSNGYGNYNAVFVSLTSREWHSLTARSNFTWGRALGTGAVTQSTSSYTTLNPWDIKSMYGPQAFDIKFLYNLTMVYQNPFFKSQRGVLGRALGGWTFAPLFTAQSGDPLRVGISGGAANNCQSFGEVNCSSGSTQENAVIISKFTGGNSANYNVVVPNGAGLNGNASKGGSGINMFADPNAVYSQFRRLILGVDTNGGGTGVIRGFPTWNLDLTVSKNIRATERLGVSLLFQFTNLLNHFQPDSTTTNFMNLDSPASFGVVTGQANDPRRMEFGLRIHF